MKYKADDRVRIKSIDWYNSTRDSDGWINLNGFKFNPDMKKFCGKTFTIKDVWLEDYYEFKGNEYCWTDDMIEGLVEEETENWADASITDDPFTVTYGPPSMNDSMSKNYKDLLLPKDQDDKLATEISYNGTKFIAPEGWLIGKTTKVNDSYLIEYVKKPTVYPNTYEECCKVMGVNHTNIIDICQHCDYKTEITYYEDRLLEKIEALYRLRICRDAYWKIAGEEIWNTGKPWEPDWNNEKQVKYGLYEKLRNTIINPSLFVFPTAEMRDAFYNNFINSINDFKDII